jgi:acetolactate synthase-1/2/3 large subunit
MTTTTGGEVIARCLAAENVRFAFGLPCPELDPLLAALEANRIRFVPVRHESAAAYLAAGVHETTGQVAAVLTNPGPGSANALPGLIDARHHGIPLVVITAQHRLGIVYPSPPTTFQGQDQLEVFRAAVKWGAPILAWERIGEVMRMAFREMWNGRPGPVQLEIPAPVQYATGDLAAAPVLGPERYRAAPPQASQAQLAAAARLLASAERPLVVAGSGVERADASAVLLALAERLGCPVIPTMAARGALPLDDPHALYGYGAGADLARREADVILAAGTRLGNLDVPYDKYWGDGARQQLIQIDVDPRSLGVSRPLALGIVGEVRAALAGIKEELERLPLGRREGKDLLRYREIEAGWRDAQLAGVSKWQGPGIHPAQVMGAVAGVFGRDAVYAADGGNTSLWAHWFLPPTRPRSYLHILELGMLGRGIPAAIGAKLASPEREVVCVTGDGAAGFHFLELQSAAREGLALTVVVCAEGSWTMEVPNEQLLYGRTFGTEMGEVRWDRVAEGLGCAGFFVERAGDLDAALRSARAAGRPAVVCVRTDRGANLSIPPALIQRFVEVYQGPLG